MKTCARNLASCRGEVRLYRLALRPAHELHRLCAGCVVDLAGAPLHLEFIPAADDLPVWRRRLVAKDFSGSVA